MTPGAPACTGRANGAGGGEWTVPQTPRLLWTAVSGDFLPCPGSGVSEPRNGVILGSDSASGLGYMGSGPVSAPKWMLLGRKDVDFRIPLTLDPTPRAWEDLAWVLTVPLPRLLQLLFSQV